MCVCMCVRPLTMSPGLRLNCLGLRRSRGPVKPSFLKNHEYYEPDFSETMINLNISHPACKTHSRMNEISRKFPEFASSVRGNKSARECVFGCCPHACHACCCDHPCCCFCFCVVICCCWWICRRRCGVPLDIWGA